MRAFLYSFYLQARPTNARQYILTYIGDNIMNKKDYILIAGAIAGLNKALEQSTRNQAEAIADVLQADSDRFNRAKFLEHCGFVRYTLPNAVEGRVS